MDDLHSELLTFIPEARHCVMAELSALLVSIGNLDDDGCFVVSHTLRREGVFKKCFTLLEKAFNMRFVDLERGILLNSDREGQKVVSALCLGVPPEERARILLKNDCCRHSYLRGLFLCCGSLMDPKRGYRLEFTVRDREEVRAILFALGGSETPSVTERRGRSVVYLKNGGAIADLLTAMGAYTSLMELENARILREVRGDVNRRVNIEAANIGKTIRSSAKQTEDIRFIESTVGLNALPESLYAAAVMRLRFPEESLAELGKLMDRPVSKSAMNHRMQRISEAADRLRRGEVK